MRISRSTRHCKKARTCDSNLRQDGPSSEFLPRLQFLHALQKNMADNGESLGADLIEIVFGGVPVTIVYEISDDIHGGNAAFHERVMVVFGGRLLIAKEVRVAQLVSGIPNEVDQ